MKSNDFFACLTYIIFIGEQIDPSFHFLYIRVTGVLQTPTPTHYTQPKIHTHT